MGRVIPQYLTGSPVLLDHRFPLPLDRPFTLAQAVGAGLTRRRLATLVQRGLLRRPIRGVYVAATVPDDQRLRLAVLLLVAAPGSVVCDWTACWWWTGLDHPNSHLGIEAFRTFRVAGRGRLRNPVADSGTRTFVPDDLVPLGAHLRVTSPLRTALDLGRLQPRLPAMGGMDALARVGEFGPPDLVAELGRFKGHRGVVQLRQLAPWVDRRSESTGESALRVHWREVPGLPVPELQIVVVRRNGEHYRLDLGVEDLRYAAEYDGEEFHGDEDAEHDHSRRRELDHEHGWTIDVFRRDDVYGRHANPGPVLRDGIAEALERRRRFL